MTTEAQRGLRPQPKQFRELAFSASGHVSVRGRSARGGAHVQNSPALCAGEPLIPRFAAAEAAATIPARVQSDRETRTACCDRLRGRTSPSTIQPRAERGAGLVSAPPRATVIVACGASSLLDPPHPRKESSRRAQKPRVSSTEKRYGERAAKRRHAARTRRSITAGAGASARTRSRRG